MNRAGFVAMAAVVLLALSGCTGPTGTPATPTTGQTETVPPTQTVTSPSAPTATGPTATGPTAARPTSTGGLVQPGPGDYPHDILVGDSFAESLDEPVDVTVSVERNGTVVFEGTSTVQPGEEGVVAGFTVSSLPPDDRRVTVTAVDGRDRSASVNVSVSSCLGSVEFFYDEEGDLVGMYALC